MRISGLSFVVLFARNDGCWWIKKKNNDKFKDEDRRITTTVAPQKTKYFQPPKKQSKFAQARGRLESQPPHGSKQPQEVIKRSRGLKCLPDRASTKHLCSKKLERGEVCKDEIHDCDGCKKNGEFIEVVVRCAQAAMSNAYSLRYTMMKKCKGVSVRDDAFGIGGDHVCWEM